MHVTDLYIYPLKSGQGIRLEKSDVTLRGLNYDRMMMVVDESGKFITQRENSKLATIQVQVNDSGVIFETPGHTQMDMAWDHFSTDADTPVQVWKSTSNVSSAPRDADRWFSKVLGQNARLVFQRPEQRRPTKQERAPGGIVSFADGYPILIASTSSLIDLNDKIVKRGGVAVPMDRFRPNIILAGLDPWAEDTIAAVDINGLRYDFIKPCTRCVMTTMDQGSGDKKGKEPLATLAKFRFDTSWEGVVFGENAYTRETGVVQVGDAVRVLGPKQNLNFAPSKLGGQ